MDIRIAIVEDTAEERKRLTDYTAQYGREKGITTDIRCFENGDEFLRAYPQRGQFDLVLLDIEMPGRSGMETARALRQIDRQVQLLFITYLVQYAIEGYSVDAADFIAKPVNYSAFCTHLDRVTEKIRFLRPRFLMTSYARETISLQIQQVSYIESLSKKTIIHMVDGASHFSSEPLYALEEKLSEETFFRCHNAYLVNLTYVQSVGAGSVAVPGANLLISKYRKKEFLQRLSACRGKML